MPPVSQNLGQVSALKVGTTPPTSQTMLWFDTNSGVNRMKYYDSTESAWVSMPFTTTINVDLVAGLNVITHSLGQRPSHISFWWNDTARDKRTLLSSYDTYIDELDDPTNKFTVVAPDALTNVIIKIQL